MVWSCISISPPVLLGNIRGNLYLYLFYCPDSIADTHCIIGWVGPRAVLHAMEMGNMCCPTLCKVPFFLDSPSHTPVTISTTLLPSVGVGSVTIMDHNGRPSRSHNWTGGASSFSQNCADTSVHLTLSVCTGLYRIGSLSARTFDHIGSWIVWEDRALDCRRVHSSYAIKLPCSGTQ